MKENRALIVVDMLYDFIDGSLACQEAEKTVSATLAFIEQKHPYPILFIRDHHPANHSSFAEYGGPWPPHCVHGTHGADIHESLLDPQGHKEALKAMKAQGIRVV